MKLLRKAVGYAGAALLGAMVVSVGIIVLGGVPPVDIEISREVRSVTYADRALRVETQVAPWRMCNADVYRFLWREESGDEIQYAPLSEFYIPITGRVEKRAVIHVHIPSDVPPGAWNYRAVSIDHCAWWEDLFRPRIHQTTDFAFVIP